MWAEKKGKLEKRSITLGEHDETTDTYDVLDGLTLEDYIAFPDEQLCHNGAPTTHEMTASENADMPMDNMGEGGMDMPMEDMPMEDMPMEDMPAEGMDMMPEESISGETGEMPGEDAAAAETVSTEGGVSGHPETDGHLQGLCAGQGACAGAEKCQPDHGAGRLPRHHGAFRFRQDHPDEHYRLPGRSHFRHIRAGRPEFEGHG